MDIVTPLPLLHRWIVTGLYSPTVHHIENFLDSPANDLNLYREV